MFVAESKLEDNFVNSQITSCRLSAHRIYLPSPPSANGQTLRGPFQNLVQRRLSMERINSFEWHRNPDILFCSCSLLTWCPNGDRRHQLYHMAAQISSNGPCFHPWRSMERTAVLQAPFFRENLTSRRRRKCLRLDKTSRAPEIHSMIQSPMPH